MSDLGRRPWQKRPGVVWKEDRLKAKGVGGAVGLGGRGGRMKIWPQTEGQGWRKRLRGIDERQSSERGGGGGRVGGCGL